MRSQCNNKIIQDGFTRRQSTILKGASAITFRTKLRSNFILSRKELRERFRPFVRFPPPESQISNVESHQQSSQIGQRSSRI
jgi:hypothetical protein